MKSMKDALTDIGAPTDDKPERKPTSSLYDDVCPECYGSGYADGNYNPNASINEINFCSCPLGTAERNRRSEEVLRKHAQQIAGGCDAAGIPPKYRKFPLSSFKDKNHAIVKAIILAESGVVDRKNSLFLYGENGARKTTLGCAILLERIAQGNQCLFVRGSRILDEVQDTYGSGQSKVAVLDKYRNIPWLMIDELVEGFVAKELTPDKIGILSEIISERYDWERPTIITSNLNLDALSKLLKTPKLTDRIFESYAICEMIGNFRF